MHHIIAFHAIVSENISVLPAKICAMYNNYVYGVLMLNGLILFSAYVVDAGRVSHARECVQYKPTTCGPQGCRFCCASNANICEQPRSQAKVVGYYEPKNPFLEPVGTCSHSFKPGVIVIIKVNKIIGAAGHQFMRVDFRSGADDQNIVMHLSLRLGVKELVRNSCDMGNWGAEDRHAGAFPFPFEKSIPFEYEFRFDNRGSDIYVNQKMYTRFEFRNGLDLDEIDYIFVEGAVLESVQIWHF